VPTKDVPHVALEEFAGYQIVVRIRATPTDHRQGGRLAGEVLDAVTALSESSTYAGGSEHDWNRDISQTRSGHSADRR
jgi:hypothetical protein